MRRVLGAGLVVAAVVWVLVGPTLTWPTVRSEAPVVPAGEPRVVEAASRAAQSTSSHITFAGARIKVTRLDAERGIVCLDPTQCALFRRGGERVLVNQEEGAKKTLLRAAQEGEPR